MTAVTTTSWGRVNHTRQDIREPAFLDEVAQHLVPESPSIAYGLGRSYGDVCLNGGGILIRTHRLDRVMSVDWQHGIIRAEAGLSFDALLQLVVPRGWFLPVTPGTKFVTLGGAVANDVHGKNHESAGTIGCHVRAIGLLRSSGEVLHLSQASMREMFAATIGGLGLTGFILWVELQLAPIKSAYFETETTRISNLVDFFCQAKEQQEWPYTAAWVDCFARGAATGRGLFIRGRHAEAGGLEVHDVSSRLRIPIDAPTQLLRGPTVPLFNMIYSGRPGVEGRRRVHYDSFLYPLDRILDWNRLYGRSGFFQHQSVVPLDQAPYTLRRLLELTSTSRQGSFLVVLKLFGKRPSPGLLSFPREGATFALDLPNRGSSTRELLGRMAAVVTEAGGAVYPAKDATMSPEVFRAGFPRWKELEAHRDPAMMSDFWRRVARYQT
jgi:L-gulonolactone oxidase